MISTPGGFVIFEFVCVRVFCKWNCHMSCNHEAGDVIYSFCLLDVVCVAAPSLEEGVM